MADIIASSGAGQAAASVGGWTVKMEVRNGKPSLFVTAPDSHQASMYLERTPNGLTVEMGYGIIDVSIDGKWVKEEE